MRKSAVHIRLELQREDARFLAVVGLAADFPAPLGFYDRAQAGEDDIVIVGDKNSDLLFHNGAATCNAPCTASSIKELRAESFRRCRSLRGRCGCRARHPGSCLLEVLAFLREASRRGHLHKD